MENTSLVPRRFRLGWENTFNSQKHGKILSTYAENTLYCSDVYNLAQKLNNSDQTLTLTLENLPLRPCLQRGWVTLVLGLP